MIKGNKNQVVNDFYTVARDSVKKAYEGDGNVRWDAAFSVRLNTQVAKLAFEIANTLALSVVDDQSGQTSGKLAQSDVKEACKLASEWFAMVSGGSASKERSGAFEKVFSLEIKKLLNKLITITEDKPKRKYTKRKKDDDNGSSST